MLNNQPGEADEGHREQVANAPLPPGQLGISEALRRFSEEMPHEREPILDFVIRVAKETASGTSVLDIGAGDAPYRELFTHARYTTTDWAESIHPGARVADVVSPADALPVDDATFGLVLCTQVLEHVPEPTAVVDECFRVLEAGGRLAVTVPLLWELHELPHDYYRYTEPGIRYLLDKAGFVEVAVAPRSDSFSAVAQLLRNLSWAMGDADDGLSEQRIAARELLTAAASEIARLAPLDCRRIMPLGYTALARKP